MAPAGRIPIENTQTNIALYVVDYLLVYHLIGKRIKNIKIVKIIRIVDKS